jgi:hypothetical protein
MTQLARDNGIGISTAYDYRDEAITVLTAREPLAARGAARRQGRRTHPRDRGRHPDLHRPQPRPRHPSGGRRSGVFATNVAAPAPRCGASVAGDAARSRWASDSAEPLVYTRVRPEVVGEHIVDPATGGPRWRRPVRYVRPRPDLHPGDLRPDDLQPDSAGDDGGPSSHEPGPPVPGYPRTRGRAAAQPRPWTGRGRGATAGRCGRGVNPILRTARPRPVA